MQYLRFGFTESPYIILLTKRLCQLQLGVEHFVLNSFCQCNIEGSDCPKFPYIILLTKRQWQLQLGFWTFCIKQFRSMQYWRFGLSESPYINILTKRTIYITVNHLLPFLVVSSGSLGFDNANINICTNKHLNKNCTSFLHIFIPVTFETLLSCQLAAKSESSFYSTSDLLTSIFIFLTS